MYDFIYDKNKFLKCFNVFDLDNKDFWQKLPSKKKGKTEERY